MPTSSDAGRDAVIRCSGIGKKYRIGRRPRHNTLRDRLAELASRPLSHGGGTDHDDMIWALKDISLEVHRGEVLGVIGRNGSGKSTLLKLLARITRPTEGTAEIRGRVGSLLEVGAGFHQELTGRDNIFLNGAVLGLSRREIAHKFDEIVEFSGCGMMLDTPVKHYSSGMYVRLAFAVAAHLETEILLVDEALAVGDAAFQKKCLGKIDEAAGQGRTVLFVSHNLIAVDGLCTRAICLHNGEVVLDGPPAQVTSRYLREWLPLCAEVVHEDIATAPGSDRVRLRRSRVRSTEDESPDWITVHTSFRVEFEYWKLTAETHLDLVAEVFNEYGINVFTATKFGGAPSPIGLLRSWFTVPAELMNDGLYTVHLTALTGGVQAARWEDVVAFEVHDAASETRGGYHDSIPGVVRPQLEWTTRMVDVLPDGMQRE